MTVFQAGNARSLVETVRAFITLCLTMVAALGVVGGAAWWMVEPRIAPYLSVIDRLNAIDARLADQGEAIAAIKATIPRIAMIEFQSVAFARPPVVVPGERVAINYTLRRNLPCETEVIERWFSVELNAVDPRFTSEPHPATRAPIRTDFSPWARVVVVPDLPPGEWGFTPEVIPGGECAGDNPIYPPPAFLTVRGLSRQQ